MWPPRKNPYLDDLYPEEDNEGPSEKEQFWSSVLGWGFCIAMIVLVAVLGLDNVPDPEPAKWYEPKEYASQDAGAQAITIDDLFANLGLQTSEYRQSLADYYKEYYPMTWGYIYKYADNPYSYIEFYDDIWGDLQYYHGDGILFETLTRYEQGLVNYPVLSSVVYCTPSGSDYHATRDCYTLLRSKSILRKQLSDVRKYSPCSKCVGD